jgi:hypothetical protein
VPSAPHPPCLYTHAPHADPMHTHLDFAFQLIDLGVAAEHLDLRLEQLDLVIQLLGQRRLEAEQLVCLRASVRL